MIDQLVTEDISQVSRNNSAFFAKLFHVFASFSKFSDVFGPVWTCSDAFGCIRMRLGAFKCVRTLSENFGNFQKNVSEIIDFGIFLRFLHRISLYFALNLLAKFLRSTVLRLQGADALLGVQGADALLKQLSIHARK